MMVEELKEEQEVSAHLERRQKIMKVTVEDLNKAPKTKGQNFFESLSNSL